MSTSPRGQNPRRLRRQCRCHRRTRCQTRCQTPPILAETRTHRCHRRSRWSPPHQRIPRDRPGTNHTPVQCMGDSVLRAASAAGVATPGPLVHVARPPDWGHVKLAVRAAAAASYGVWFQVQNQPNHTSQHAACTSANSGASQLSRVCNICTSTVATGERAIALNASCDLVCNHQICTHNISQAKKAEDIATVNY